MQRATLALLLSCVVGACGPDPDGQATHDAAPGGPDAPAAIPDADLSDAAPIPFTMWAHTNDTLYRVDDQTFDLVLIGVFGAPEDMTDLAVTPDGTIYTISSNALYRVDETTGLATHVADVAGVDNVALTFLPDGTLLASDATGGVRRIDPATGQVTEIGAFGGGYATAGDLVAVSDGTMYGISDQGPVGDEYDNNVLLTVNTSDGTATPVGQIGYGRVFGCAYANGHVFAFTADGKLIEIDRTTGAGALIRSYPVSFWGAGVTPLVVIQ